MITPPRAPDLQSFDRELRLAELSESVSRLLPSALPPGASFTDARVSESVDERTIRYYTSLGLVDRPLRREGRDALYGLRHLLQILAVKRLQHQGESLASIQRRLAGATRSELESQCFGGPTQPPSQPAPPRTLLVHEIEPGVTLVLDPKLAPAPALDPALPARIRTLITK